MAYKIIVIPGNGGSTPNSSWYHYLEQTLTSSSHITVVNTKFPDALLARRKYWLPFIEALGTDEKTILVGHSSGAVAAMRYAQTHTILGSILVAACYTDLGVWTETLSGYYKDPWEWDLIRKNQKWIIQFASVDDPFIPIAEARFVHEHLASEYHEYGNRGHFIENELPEVVTAIKRKLDLIVPHQHNRAR